MKCNHTVYFWFRSFLSWFQLYFFIRTVWSCTASEHLQHLLCSLVSWSSRCSEEWLLAFHGQHGHWHHFWWGGISCLPGNEICGTRNVKAVFLPQSWLQDIASWESEKLNFIFQSICSSFIFVVWLLSTVTLNLYKKSAVLICCPNILLNLDWKTL